MIERKGQPQARVIMKIMNIAGLFLAAIFFFAVLPTVSGDGLYEAILVLLLASGIGYGLGAVIASLFTR